MIILIPIELLLCLIAMPIIIPVGIIVMIVDKLCGNNRTARDTVNLIGGILGKIVVISLALVGLAAVIAGIYYSIIGINTYIHKPVDHGSGLLYHYED